MNDCEYLNYASIEEYFKDHPEEENEFYDEMARLQEDNFVEYPEEWPLPEWLKEMKGA